MANFIRNSSTVYCTCSEREGEHLLFLAFNWVVAQSIASGVMFAVMYQHKHCLGLQTGAAQWAHQVYLSVFVEAPARSAAIGTYRAQVERAHGRHQGFCEFYFLQPKT